MQHSHQNDRTTPVNVLSPTCYEKYLSTNRRQHLQYLMDQDFYSAEKHSGCVEGRGLFGVTGLQRYISFMVSYPRPRISYTAYIPAMLIKD